MSVRRSAVLVLLWIMALTGVAGCGVADPERELRQRIEAAVAAAQARDTGFFRGLIAESFVDQRGNDRQALLNRMRGQFLIQQRIEVISRVEEVVMHGADAAETIIVAGIVGSTSQRLALGSVSADLYRIELEWSHNDGDWRVIGARWSRLGDL